MAGEGMKLLYMVVVDHEDEEEGERNGDHSFRYTRSVLQSTLQLMGCKPRHAFKGSQKSFSFTYFNFIASVSGVAEIAFFVQDFKREDSVMSICGYGILISKRVFEVIRSACLLDRAETTGLNTAKGYMVQKGEFYIENCLDKAEGAYLATEDDRSENKSFEMYKRRTTVVVRRKTFLDVISNALTEYKYVGPNQRADLILACRIRERQESVTVLLCGTSGCGKSTLSALLGSRLGITTVISTDSIRHMMRSFVDEKQNPLLWASTYHAGEYLDPVAVAEAKVKRKAKKLARAPRLLPKDNEPGASEDEKLLPEGSSRSADFISPKQMAIEGFKAQSEMVIDSLDRLITSWEERKESVVVEGVHLSLNFVMGLMKKHPSIIPFMVYISNEEKHLERFAVRAKYMTLDPAKNKYVKYIRNIRAIQDYLCNRADKHLVPKINNTNVDRSVAAIHATVFSSLRRLEAGDQLYDSTTNTVSVVDEEYRNQCAANSLKSKGMFQLIQRKGSSRHLMALLNNDGSVAKAWPVDSTDINGKHNSRNYSQNGVGIPMYGPLQIGKAEPVNLQFGHFGISAWPSDGGTSHASSCDDSKDELTDTGSRYYSSACSSPRISEGHSKELKEEQSVHGSDEEVDDSAESESDEDLSEDERKHHEEMEGSVDEESTKSDEEYDDLAMEDIHENGDLLDDIRQNDGAAVPSFGNRLSNELNGEKYKRNLDLFIRSKRESLSEKPQRCVSSGIRYKDERKMTSSLKLRIKRRSQSESSSWSHSTLMTSPTIQEEMPR